MIRFKEFAKFACGFEAFHALTHAYFYLSKTTVTMFGITATPPLSFASALFNAIVCIVLGVYAWGRRPGSK